VLVAAGISAGDRVAVGPIALAVDGMQVRVVMEPGLAPPPALAAEAAAAPQSDSLAALGDAP
jgi:hypothetical protein